VLKKVQSKRIVNLSLILILKSFVNTGPGDHRDLKLMFHVHNII